MRIVIKIGTSLLTTSDHTLDRQFLHEVVSQIVELHSKRHEIVIVSSGAVASGRTEVKFEDQKKSIPYRQALAAVGMPILMNAYREFLGSHGIPVAQALLTNYDFVNRENFLNTKNVFETLFVKGVIPIVNENDVTTIAELKFGDNDLLSAKTAGMIGADLLCILTDVSGLYDAHPKENPDAKIISIVKKVDARIHALAGGVGSHVSTGGMITKLVAAEYATSIGVATFIANGRKKNVIIDAATFFENQKSSKEIPAQTIGTFFIPSSKAMGSSKKWLRTKVAKNAFIDVDSGAARALKEMGKSLLPSGILGVEGNFTRGDVVSIRSDKEAFAYGQVNYDAVDLEKIKQHKSEEIEAILGFSFGDEVIHRDRLVVL